MTPLQKRVNKDYEDILKRVNSLYLLRSNEIGEVISQAMEMCVRDIAHALSHMHQMDYSTFIRSGISHRIQSDTERVLVKAGQDIQMILDDLKREMDLMGRLAVAFISRKATPPWIKIKIDLRSSTDGALGSGTSRVDYYMRLMAKDVHSYVMQGVSRKKTSHEIMTTIRGLFNTRKLSHFYETREDAGRKPDPTLFQDSYEIVGEPSIELSEGIYTLDDIDALQSAQMEADGMSHRANRPWFSAALKKNNKILSALERDFMSDMIEALHQGMLQIGTDEMGIEDFEWVVSRPQPRCDECTSRDGRTMKWIKANIKDDYADQPPPLHPNCRCQIVPQIKDQWSQDALSKDGYEFDPEDGVAFNPTAKQKKLGYKSLSWDDWLSNIPREAAL